MRATVFWPFFSLCFLRPSTFHNFPSFEHFLSFLLFGEYLRKNCYELTISRPLSQVPSIGQHSKDVWSGVSFLLSFYVVFRSHHTSQSCKCILWQLARVPSILQDGLFPSHCIVDISALNQNRSLVYNSRCQGVGGAIYFFRGKHNKPINSSTVA